MGAVSEGLLPYRLVANRLATCAADLLAAINPDLSIGSELFLPDPALGLYSVDQR
jgi:hypothetical protein